MYDWKHLFRPHILDRGLNYYEMGMVKNIRKNEDGYEADVCGSEDYEVEIELKDDEVYDMWCSCPFAEDGSYCKHMAAVLYEIEEGEHTAAVAGKTLEEMFEEKKQELIDLIAKIPEDELRSLLIHMAEEDESLRNRILIKYSEDVSADLMVRLKSEIAAITDEYADGDGYINWRDALDYTNDLQNYLYDNVQELIDKGFYMQAFELTNEVFLEAANQEIDDSSGGISILADSCHNFWKQIYEKCSEDEQEEMFQWFEKHQGNSAVVDFMEEYIENFLMEEFSSQDQLKKKLKLLDEEIKFVEDGNAENSLWGVSYNYEVNIMRRLDIMKELEYPAEEIQAYKEKYRKFSAIRALEVREYLMRGKIPEAINTLKESKEIDKDLSGLVTDYSRKLIELYNDENMEQEYKEELVFQIFSCRLSSLEFVHKLKAVCEPSEWEDYREKILTARNGWQIKYELLETEGMYERMLTEIAAEDSVWILDQYEKVLKTHFPEQVRDIYAAYVSRAAQQVADRNQYRELAGYLKKIKTYPDGEHTAAKTVEDWKVRYKRRPAMMDELRKAGF